MNRSSYKYLGENSLYTGLIFRKSKGEDKEVIVGEWVNGVKSLREVPITNNQIHDQAEIISKEQLVNLYNEYNQI